MIKIFLNLTVIVVSMSCKKMQQKWLMLKILHRHACDACDKFQVWARLLPSMQQIYRCPLTVVQLLDCHIVLEKRSSANIFHFIMCP